MLNMVLNEVELTPKKRKMFEKIIKIFGFIKGENTFLRKHLDKLSPFSREGQYEKLQDINQITPMKELFDWFSDLKYKGNDEKINAHTISNLFLFTAFLSIEITDNYYTDLSKSMELTGGVLRNIAVSMKDFIDSYLLDDQNETELEKDTKTHVQYFTKAIQKWYLKNEKEECSLSAKDAVNAKNDTLNILEDAKKILAEAQEMVPKILKDSADELSKTFRSLLDIKHSEKSRAFWVLFVMGALAAIAPFGIWHFFGEINYNPYDASYIVMLILKTISAIAVEGLLIYFYRIILHDYHKIKTEIIQLEIREAISNFLPSYTAYAKSSACAETNAILEHFSNFIFKPLVSNSNDIPKLTDGLDSIANLINKVKN